MGGSNNERAARQDQVSGAGTSILGRVGQLDRGWHYERVNLPKEIPNQALEFDFVTKVGYGKNVLQRDQAILTALERVEGDREARDRRGGGPTSRSRNRGRPAAC